MKINKILTILSVLLFVCAQSSCVDGDDYDTPDLTINSVDPTVLGNKTNFNNVIATYLTAVADGKQIGSFGFDDDLYIEGYVISSDRDGNFFEELIIQNSPNAEDAGTDPRRGLNIQINVPSLSDTYEVGRKIYIKLNGLAIGEENGVYTLGREVGNSLKQIQSFEYQYDEDKDFPTFILRDSEITTIEPKIISISELSETDENTLIQLENTQINRNELGLDFAGQLSDEFDGFRTLESCTENADIKLQTSTFADFKSVLLPEEQGSITGIYSRDFGDDFNVLIINDLANIMFDNVERCDPIELDCGLASSQGASSLFTDDFETQVNNTLIAGNGWTNYIEEGTEGWEAFSSEGTNSSLGISVRVSSYGSGDTRTIAWLITPEINLDDQDNETLNFKTSNSFSDDSSLEILFSTDWDGTEATITAATWGVLPAAYVVQNDDFFGAWFNSGDVSLSCATGTIHIAFKYTGNDIGNGNANGTYELDNVSIDHSP